MSTLAVITGTTRGIGAALLAAAKDAGAMTASVNRRSLGEAGELVVDLSNPASWTEFAAWLDATVLQHEPERMVAIHNAATINPIGTAGSVDLDAYTQHVLANAGAPMVLGAAIVGVAERHELPTRLMQISSGASITPFPGWSGYCASKAAVDQWTAVVGAEQTQTAGPVEVLSIAPGVVDTGMQADIRESTEAQFSNIDRFKEMKVNGQLSDPREVGAKLWRIASESSWPNGARADITEFA